MAATSTTATKPFTPSWRCDDEGNPREGAPVFHLRAGSLTERGRLEAALAAPPYRAGRVYGYELRAALREGVSHLLAGDPDRDRMLDLIDSEVDGDLDAADRALLVEVRELLSDRWPAYGALLAQLERRRELAPLLALRTFCTGIEAQDVTFALDRTGLVSEATMSQVDPLELMAAGNEAYGMLYPEADAAGN